jgi:hypothetical protein
MDLPFAWLLAPIFDIFQVSVPRSLIKLMSFVCIPYTFWSMLVNNWSLSLQLWELPPKCNVFCRCSTINCQGLIWKHLFYLCAYVCVFFYFDPSNYSPSLLGPNFLHAFVNLKDNSNMSWIFPYVQMDFKMWYLLKTYSRRIYLMKLITVVEKAHVCFFKKLLRLFPSVITFEE